MYLLDELLHVVQILVDLVVDLLDGLSQVFNSPKPLQYKVELCGTVRFDRSGSGMGFKLFR